MSKHTHVIGCLFSLIVLGACAPHQPAMAGEPATGVARSAMATANAAAPGVDEASFPLPIWKGIAFPHRDHVSGALLPTAEGTIQINKLRWGVDRDGFLVACSLTGYTQDGDPVSFTGPDAEACASPASKSAIQKAPVAVSGGGSLESFNFGTDHRGFLFFTDIVYQPGTPANLQDGTCGFVDTIVCLSEHCSIACGTPVQPTFSAGGILTIGPYRSPGSGGAGVTCNCTGEGGHCVAHVDRQCLGTCPEGETCTLDNSPTAGLSCTCE